MPEPTPPESAIGVHTEFIEQHVADWFKKAQPHRQLALHATLPTLPPWLQGASDEERQTLRRAHEQLRSAVNATDQLLGSLADLHAFAEPLLKHAIKTTFDLDLDVHYTFLARKLANTQRSDLGGILVFDTTRNYLVPHYREITLLQAALENFESGETSPDTCTDCRVIVPYRNALWPIEIALPIAPDAFARMCRTLDLGQHYRDHLNLVLNPGDATLRAHVRERLMIRDKATLALSAHTALIKKDIKADTHAMVLQVIASQSTVYWYGKPVRYSRMKILNTVISDMLLISPDRESSTTERVLLYIPGDDTQPLKEYASYRQCVDELLERLKAARYRHFFAQFIGLSEQGEFFHQLKRSFDPHNTLDHSDDYSGTSKGLEFADEFINDLWPNRSEVFIRKILSDAQTAAVPTEVIDQRTRLFKIEGVFDAAINTFSFASMFIPGLGEIMMLVGCAQMLNDAFTGIEAWEQGEIDQAWAHLAGVALNVGFIGVSGQVAPTIKNAPFVDGLQPVTLPDSETRLWNPDLQPYVHDEPIPDTLVPNEIGLYPHHNGEFLLIDGQPFRAEKTASGSHYQIKHPTRTHSYSPRLRNNRMGAWAVETEEPLQWPDTALLKRLSPACAGFTDEQAARILAITHTDPAVLRRVHADALPTPALLADTVQRFKIDLDIEAFITQMEHPTRRLDADPQTQLQLLTGSEHWPASKGLRVLNDEGEVMAQYGHGDKRVTFMDIQDGQIRKGEWLDTVLQNLDIPQTRALLETSPAFGDELPNLRVKVDRLYVILANMARSRRRELFISRYATLELRANAEVALLQREMPGLPVKAAQELIWHASGDEILQLLNDKTLPVRLREEARWQLLETRVNRAYEGLFMDSASHPDSEWMIIKTLETLPGWSSEIRLEIREGNVEGKLLNSIGTENAPLRKILVKADNRYSAHDSEGLELSGAQDLYGAVLHALPDTERTALGFPQVGQGAALKARVRQHPLLPRMAVRLYLDHPPVAQEFKSPMALVHGRASYPLLGADAPHRPPTSIDRMVHRLYPDLSARERVRIMTTLPTDRAEAVRILSNRHAELRTLRDDLEVWTVNAPAASQITGELVPENFHRARVRDRQAFSEELVRGWRRQTAFDNHYPDPDRNGFQLTFTRLIQEDMPTISADFSHVSYLCLYGAGPVTGVNEFLLHFPGLRVLDLRGFALDRLPEALYSMPNLSELRLEDSSITLTPTSVAGLAGLEHLEYIDLDDNPLNLTPNFGNMPNLNTLYMRNAGLSEFPHSLLDLSELEVIDLRENQMTTLPNELFGAPTFITEALELGDNPLSPATLDHVRDYFNQTGITMGVPLDNVDPLIIDEPEE